MSVTEAIHAALTPLSDVEDCQAAVDLIGGAEFALLGEASHGTHEFYAARSAITKTLIIESGFRAVAIEGDWPDAYRVNRYVRHVGGDKNAVDALSDFKRFPTWMWRNVVVVEFIEWLREHNEGLPVGAQVGFYGMDLYALMRRYGRSSHISRKSIQPARRAPARGMPASIRSAKMRSPPGIRRLSVSIHVRAMWCASWWNCSSEQPTMRRATAESPGTNSLSPNRMPGS
jgi:erythromycin esterase-like protein